MIKYVYVVMPWLRTRSVPHISTLPAQKGMITWP